MFEKCEESYLHALLAAKDAGLYSPCILSSNLQNSADVHAELFAQVLQEMNGRRLKDSLGSQSRKAIWRRLQRFTNRPLAYVLPQTYVPRSRRG
mgnify:FL=1